MRRFGVQDSSAAAARVADKKPYIEIKDVIVARSGIYAYTHAEVLAKGHTPKRVKDTYLEFRPASVIAAAAHMFELVPVSNKEHTDVDIDSNNFHALVSAIIGGPISVVPMPDSDDIGLSGRLAFFTKDAYEYYKAGNKETSADYVSKSVLVDNPEELGYDLKMLEILSVNNVAITKMGRGGKDVRVQDSGINGSSVMRGSDFDALVGRKNMGMLRFLGLGDPSEKKFSAVVKDSLTAIKTAKVEDRAGIVDKVMEGIAQLSPSDNRGMLETIVRDSLLNPDKVLENWKKAEVLIDGIHARCVDADAAVAAQVLDAEKAESEKKEKEEKEEKEKAGKKDDEKEAEGKKVTDSMSALVDEKLAAFESKLPSLFDAALKKALNLGAAAPAAPAARALDSATPELLVANDGDVSFILDGAFGSGRS